MVEFETAVSEAREGRVLIRGYSHEDIIGRVAYADATYLTLVGELPSPAQASLVNAILTSLLDHGFVASTITAARYIASGNPQFIPAVAGGLLAAGQNTLSPEHAYRLIQQAQRLRQEQRLTVDDAAALVVNTIQASGERVPGFGHPIHRDGDFRANVLFARADELGLAGDATEMFRAIHRAFVRITGKAGVPINIDGCLACLGMDLGLSADQTVALAVLAVLPGLMAQVVEELESGKPLRHIRDGAYVGEPERQLPDGIPTESCHERAV
jgi:citrate synthase